MGGKGKKLEEQKIAVSPVVTPSRSSASLFSRFLIGSAIASFSLFTPNFSKADGNKPPVLVAKTDGPKNAPQAPPAPLKEGPKVAAANAPARTVSTQDGVANLKPFSLQKLVELDAKADAEYDRKFWVRKDQSLYTDVRVGGQNGNYLIAVAGINPQTLEKGMSIQYPKDGSNPNGERVSIEVDFQTLFTKYVEAGGKAKNPWVKIILDVDDAGVTIFANLVDEKPKPNDSSDLKAGYPVIALRYFKEKNIVSIDELYFRVEDSGKIAQK